MKKNKKKKIKKKEQKKEGNKPGRMSGPNWPEGPECKDQPSGQFGPYIMALWASLVITF